MLEDSPVSIFERSVRFDPAGDFDAFLKAVPARWVVYLLADADDRPVQLLCVRNLRYSLKRRLGTSDESTLSKRIDYRALVRNIHWRRVDSAFEADWLYYEAARVLFPKTYAGMVGFRPAWFIHVDPDAKFPRYTKTIDLSTRTGQLLGPVADKHAAARLIELAEDAFDLCRYYKTLTESPHGKACAYKEMGKCPAPCDGSISIEQYRRLVEWSAQTLIDPAPMIEDQTRRMHSAAAAQRFETAAKIKSFTEVLSTLGKGAFRRVRELFDFRYLSLQPGPETETAKLFLIAPGRIEEIAGLTAEPESASDLLQHALARSAEQRVTALDLAGAERIGIVAHHLFWPKAGEGSSGAFLQLETAERAGLVKAFGELQKRKPVEVEGEGVTRELDAGDADGL